MKRYLIGLFLILLIAGCQQPAATTPEPTAQAIVPETTPAETVEEVVEETVEEEVVGEVEEAPTGADVSILGEGGFDPEELRVSEGSTVVFKNNGDKLVTLNVWEGRRVIDTTVVKSGQVGELTFDKAGSFEVRTLEYVTSISVIVE